MTSVKATSKSIPVSSVVASSSRRSPMKGRIASVAESMRTIGLLHPIVVVVAGKDKYKLIAGMTRLEAAKLLENTFRFVNISLIHELNETFKALGLDTNAVIDAAATLLVSPLRGAAILDIKCSPAMIGA